MLQIYYYYVFIKFIILVNRLFELIYMDKLPIGYVKGKGNVYMNILAP